MSAISTDTPLSDLTIEDRKALIREILSEQLQKEYYATEHGIRVLYQTEQMEPAYVRELQADHDAYQKGKLKIASSKAVMDELKALGAKI